MQNEPVDTISDDDSSIEIRSLTTSNSNAAENVGLSLPFLILTSLLVINDAPSSQNFLLHSLILSKTYAKFSVTLNAQPLKSASGGYEIVSSLDFFFQLF